MAAQKGMLFLLKVYNGATYDSVLTARATDFTINSETVDVTNKGTNGWRALLEGAAPRSMTITLEGVFEDETYEETLRAAAHGATFETYELVSANGDKWSGDFIITSYSRAGQYNSEETYSITLESANAITFTAGT